MQVPPNSPLNQSRIKEISSRFPELELITEPSEFAYWAQDWTRFYQPQPLAIAFPKNVSALSDLLKHCSEQGLAVTPSGGRTGLSGGAVAMSGELVISLSKFLDIGEVNVKAGTLRVQAGVVTKLAQERALMAGLYFPLDLASSGSCTIGGNIATNAGGLHVVRYGHIRRWIQSIEVVLMNGDTLELNGDLDKNNTGYDLRNLFIGSEGTLGFITAATLKLCEKPQQLKTFLFALPKLPIATQILDQLRSQSFVVHSFEVLSKNCFELVHQVRKTPKPFAGSSPYYLLFEIDTLSSNETEARLDSWMEKIFHSSVIQEGFMAQNDREQKDFWSWRENITECLNTRGKVYKNDLAVPVAAIDVFMKELETLASNWFGEQNLFLFGHLGDGNIHVNLLKPESMELDDFRKTCELHNDALFTLVHSYEGSIAAEHGIGLLKKQYLHYSKTALEIELMKHIKRAFDPLKLLNPGKIFDL